MSDIILGTCPIAVRQKLAIGSYFQGLAPQIGAGPTLEYLEPAFSNDLWTYQSSSTPPVVEAWGAGLFSFSSQPAEIAAIHLDVADAGTPGNLDITIEDSDGSCVRTIASLTGIDNYYWTPAAGVRVFMLPFQVLKIDSSKVTPGTKAAGFKHATVYVVKSYVAGLV